ncbi:endonuclease [Pontibacillus chungwhensis BH030062]|uniref:Endonuclease n=1 Tax=Pontibacillus chungwhensis BH030062 TaxID=1385513 RepID=A0A0A2USG8_9BACI|nr:Z1 domain-containing protein [Pontibacillus chungwhensis]KGP91257.1 endonuclease [Pontibacillus chungwhensis BH030062]
MKDLSMPCYDGYRNWIRDVRKKGLKWSEIEMGRSEDEEGLRAFLNNLEFTFLYEHLENEEWKEIVKRIKRNEEESEYFQARSKSAMITDSTQNNGSEIPMDEKSSWQLYKSQLKEKGFKETAIDEIEKSSVSILKRLSNDTRDVEPVKGMVVGNVQSGKTANMAALMAMAADHGWNMFIVLSGMVENLRKQTQERLIQDLNHPGNIHWRPLENVNAHAPFSSQTANLHLHDSKNAHLYVCLKNKKRLEGLIDWMQKDPNKYKQMKVLVIDDEADQGSINTADVTTDERKAINRLIVNLVAGKTKNDKVSYAQPKAMNYISYTATPYANFLNEYSDESLYPSSFIKTLSTVTQYFGPKEIFGVEGNEKHQGMDIVREIDDNDYNEIKTMQKGEHNKLPDSLKDSICWFLCATASMKLNGYKKPISMMVHTSQKQEHHTHVANSIREWLKKESQRNLLRHCEKVWKRETNRFNYDDFTEAYPDYSGNHEKMYGFMPFNKIEASIATLIKDVTHIPLDDNEELDYHQNIHLCVDNSANNGLNDEGMYVRLAYPDEKKNEELGHATAFIVVGGTTLSRGLTIEGLVSTYFLRGSLQADTLMQMGRWFGYRPKYELYPRIWMTEDTKEKFEFLATLEYELRDTLQQFSIGSADPSTFGPRVKNTPRPTWLRVTSNDKQQSALKVQLDFTGTSPQTIFFENDEEKMRHNKELTESFLSELSGEEVSDFKNSYVYRNVKFNDIASKLLEKFSFHQKTRTFGKDELPAFIDWIKNVTENGDLGDWNVVVSGKGNVNNEKENEWSFSNGLSVGKVTRNKKKNSSDETTFNIGVLRAPKDLLADVKQEKLTEESKKKLSSSNPNVTQIRQEAELGSTPQLLIYCIDQGSTVGEKQSENINKEGDRRINLDAPEDIIGISVRIPGINPKTGASYGGLQIDIPVDKMKDKGGLEEE